MVSATFTLHESPVQSRTRSESDYESEFTESEREATPDLKSFEKNARKSQCVRFSCAHLIEFEPTIHCAGVASDGVPIGMSNKVRCQARYSIDLWEHQRQWSRVTRQNFMENGYLEPEERISILFEAGFSEEEIDDKMEETNHYNEQRWETNEYDMRYQRCSYSTPDSEDETFSRVDFDFDQSEATHSRYKTQENDVTQNVAPTDFYSNFERMRVYDSIRIPCEEDSFHFSPRDVMEMFDTKSFEPECSSPDTNERMSTQSCTMSYPINLQNQDVAIVVAV